MSKFFYIFILSTFIFSASAVYADTEGSPSLLEGKQLYAWYCTSCHGIKGDGKGFNSKNLDPRPANHTDAEMMRRRSNKDLHEAVSGGGRKVGKATLMPPWGEIFSREQIDSLVMYMKELCGCE